MNLKVISKFEFWTLAVPSLMVSIGAIAHYGCWRMLWVFAIEFELATVLHFGRGLVTELLCEPRTNACRAGKWPVEG